MTEWLMAATVAVAASGLISVLFSAFASWVRQSRKIKFKIGSAEVELSPRDMGINLDQLERAAGELREHPTVFLSHAGTDREFARRLASDLEARGVRVWFPEREIAVGDKLSSKITEGLDASQWVVVVVSPEVDQSKWLRAELKMALREESRRDRPLVLPVLYSGEALPGELADRVYADFRSDYEAGLRSLLRTIRRQSSEPLDVRPVAGV